MVNRLRRHPVTVECRVRLPVAPDLGGNMKLVQVIIVVLLLGACQKPSNVTIQTPEPPAPIVVDGGIICRTTVSQHKTFEGTGHCPAADLVLTGTTEDGVECATLQTECWVKSE